MPSLENWGSGLESFMAAYTEVHSVKFRVSSAANFTNAFGMSGKLPH